MSSVLDVLGVLAYALFILAPLLAAILVGAMTRGPVRALGVAGFSIFTLEGLLGVAWLYLVPLIADGGNIPLSRLATGYSLLQAVLSLVAFALLAFAVVVDRSRTQQAPAYRS